MKKEYENQNAEALGNNPSELSVTNPKKKRTLGVSPDMREHLMRRN